MKTIAGILPHISIILAGMLIVFFVLDRFNPSMVYLDNTGERALLLTLAAISIVNAILLIGYQRRT